MNGVISRVPLSGAGATPGVGRRPAVVIGRVQPGQVAVFADAFGRTIQAGEAITVEMVLRALAERLAAVSSERPATPTQAYDRLAELIGALKEEG